MCDGRGNQKMQTRRAQRLIFRSSVAAWLLLTNSMLTAQGTPPSTLAPASTPAHQIFDLSVFVVAITGGIFLAVGGLLAVALYRFRARKADPLGEPDQIYGSTQIELAWTVIPVLIVVVLFLTTARIIFAIQDAPRPKTALDVTVIGHQFWWEFRYPKYGVVTANELHIPVSSDATPATTFLKLTSADVNHSFWIPQLAGKTDLIANHVNTMWMDPQKPGLYLLTSDFVNIGLSAFLCFSGRLLYPSYGVVERPFGIDALKDQIAAGAFMWVFGSLVFLIPAIYLTTRFLANGRLVNEKTGLERARALAQ
jgi:heme/copper-type cytochrome/quinol oxidase subunit 2